MALISKESILAHLLELGINKHPNILLALDLAGSVHKNQKRDTNGPFLEEHIYPVVENILNRHSKYSNLVSLTITAILHDVIEDGGIEFDNLKNSFGIDIANNVLALSKKQHSGNQIETQEMKYNRVKECLERVSNSSEIAQIVKIEDRLQNMESTRKIVEKKEKYLRMVREIRELFIPLANRMNSSFSYPNLLENEAKRVEALFS